MGAAAVVLFLLGAPTKSTSADIAAPSGCEKTDVKSGEFADCVAAVETKLNESYKAYLRRFDVKLPVPEVEHLPEKKTAVIDAERAWVRYRDAECEIYDIAQGNLSSYLKMDCMARIAAERIRELEALATIVP
jgi:uncharacterized protein YecT (DUF1311 family)